MARRWAGRVDQSTFSPLRVVSADVSTLDERSDSAEHPLHMARQRLSKLQRATAPDARTPVYLFLVDRAIWIIGRLKDVDFVFSVANGKVAGPLQSLLFGKLAWLPILGCVIWYAFAVARPTGRLRSWAIRIAVAVFSFTAGAMLVAANTNEPKVFIEWGHSPVGCDAAIDTRQLLGFIDSHQVVLICGPEDDNADQLLDKRVQMSIRYNITGGPVRLRVNFRQDGSPLTTIASAWLRIGLVPKGLDLSEMRSVTDLANAGARVLKDVMHTSIRPVAIPEPPSRPVPSGSPYR